MLQKAIYYILLLLLGTVPGAWLVCASNKSQALLGDCPALGWALKLQGGSPRPPPHFGPPGDRLEFSPTFDLTVSDLPCEASSRDSRK